MTILCWPDAEASEALRPSLGDGLEVVDSLPAAAMTIAEHPDELLVVIGQQVPFEQVVAFTLHVRADHPDVSIVLQREHEDQAVEAAAVAAGIDQVVHGSDVHGLVDAARRFGQPPRDAAPPTTDVGSDLIAEPTERRPGRIVSVFSPKGGAGKTTIATNLAFALHAAGLRVCLVDLDLEFGDVAISLRLEPTHNLVDGIAFAPGTPDHVLLGALVTSARPNLDCVLAPVEPGDADKIPPSLIIELLACLRRHYDAVVVDTPSRFSEHVLAAMDASDHDVLVTNPEIPALKNLRLTIDMMDLLGYASDARSLVVNKEDDGVGLTGQEVEQALGMPILAHVPMSRDVPLSINKGVPLVEALPDHPISKTIRDFASRRFFEGPTAELATSARRKGRLFSRGTK